jgi:hypothetical protein
MASSAVLERSTQRTSSIYKPSFGASSQPYADSRKKITTQIIRIEKIITETGKPSSHQGTAMLKLAMTKDN